MGKNKLVELVKNAYDMTEEEAISYIEECQALVDEALVEGRTDDVEMILADYGFEMDYIHYFI